MAGEPAWASCGTSIMTGISAVTDPDVPVIVAEYVPEATVLAAVKVNVLLVLVLAGLNDAVMPAGSPETARLTVPLNPFAPTTLMVLSALVPAAIVNVPAEEERLKLHAGTSNVTGTELVRLPDVPVIVTVYVPAATVPLDVNVTALESDVLGAAKDALIPAGNPEMVSDTALEKPPAPTTEILLV